jgi:hypothetical protein
MLLPLLLPSVPFFFFLVLRARSVVACACDFVFFTFFAAPAGNWKKGVPSRA